MKTYTLQPTEVKGFKFGKKFLLEAIKANGMTLETALGELIDNSIDKDASEIIIQKTKQVDLPGQTTDLYTFSIIDNGSGMSHEKLIECVSTFGYHEEYSLTAISNYGVGLKLALLNLSKGGLIDIYSYHQGWVSHVQINTASDVLIDNEITVFPSEPTSRQNGTLIKIQNVEDSSHKTSLLKYLGATYYPKWVNSQKKFKIKLIAGAADTEHKVEFTDPMYRHLGEDKVKKISQQFTVGGHQAKITAYILDEDYFSDEDFNSYDNRRDTSNGKKFVQNRAGIYLRLHNRYISLGGGYFPGYVAQHYFNKTRVEVEIPKEAFAAFGVQINKSKCDINIEKPELADFKKVYKTLINDSYRKVPKNSSKLTNTDFERIKDDSLKVNGVLKKGSMKNPLENPNVRKFVKETKASTLETVETSNQLMILNESNLGERDLFIVVERQDVQTVMTINRDHPFFDKFVELEPNGRQLIITTLFSQYYAFLEVLNQNDFKASTYNIILDDFWRNQTDYLRRLYAL